MENIIHDVRENWTEEEWRDYNESVAEAMAEDAEMALEEFLKTEGED